MNLAVAVYEKLKLKVGEDGAVAILDYVDSKVEETAVTKLDLAKVESSLGSEIQRVESSLGSEIQGVESSLGTEIQKVESNLGVEIHNLRAEIQRVENKLEAAIQQIRAEIRELESRIDIKMNSLEWKMKLHSLALGALIVVTNPKVLDILGKLLGIIK
ncbi:MAG: hypothetical protein QME81_03845 [bacterium]|nr:hypothetical protein [bacterium]